MSKQLAVSAAFSVFAMAAFALFATPAAERAGRVTGAEAFATAPAFGQPLAQLPVIAR